MIYKKLANIQKDLVATKSQYNNFGKYSYRSCEDILQAVKPLLQREECGLILSDDIVEVGGRVYVKATATLFDKDDNETTQNTAFAREDENKKGMDGSQITGSSSSYARKYALAGLFLLDDNKDADSWNKGDGQPQEKPKDKIISETKQQALIMAIEKLANKDQCYEWIKSTYGDIKTLTEPEFYAINQVLNRKRKDNE